MTLTMLNILADDLLEEGEKVQALKIGQKRSPAKHMLAKHLSRLAKSEFGRIKNTESNNMVVRRYIRDQARELHVRHSDIHHLCTWGVYYFFIADGDEIEVTNRSATRAYTDNT
jgi:hypothetical protein